MKRLRIIDVAICAVVAVCVAAALAPALGRTLRQADEAKCMANLRKWGEAMELYLSDHGDRYPTNRIRTSAGIGIITTPIPISQPDPIPPATEPPVFEYGINWVEALYPYVKVLAAKTDQDWRSFRRCPNATNNVYPTSSADLHWSMSYVFSGALVEQKRGLVMRVPSAVMMIREFGRLTVATLRPSDQSSVRSGAAKPMYPFLNKTDRSVPGGTANECQLHGGGSYILFADGHVRHFTLDYYPEYSAMTAANAFDSTDTYQWYNYYYANPTTEEQRAKNKSIAITP